MTVLNITSILLFAKRKRNVRLSDSWKTQTNQQYLPKTLTDKRIFSWIYRTNFLKKFCRSKYFVILNYQFKLASTLWNLVFLYSSLTLFTWNKFIVIVHQKLLPLFIINQRPLFIINQIYRTQIIMILNMKRGEY